MHQYLKGISTKTKKRRENQSKHEKGGHKKVREEDGNDTREEVEEKKREEEVEVEIAKAEVDGEKNAKAQILAWFGKHSSNATTPRPTPVVPDNQKSDDNKVQEHSRDLVQTSSKERNPTTSSLHKKAAYASKRSRNSVPESQVISTAEVILQELQNLDATGDPTDRLESSVDNAQVHSATHDMKKNSKRRPRTRHLAHEALIQQISERQPLPEPCSTTPLEIDSVVKLILEKTHDVYNSQALEVGLRKEKKESQRGQSGADRMLEKSMRGRKKKSSTDKGGLGSSEIEQSPENPTEIQEPIAFWHKIKSTKGTNTKSAREEVRE